MKERSIVTMGHTHKKGQIKTTQFNSSSFDKQKQCQTNFRWTISTRIYVQQPWTQITCGKRIDIFATLRFYSTCLFTHDFCEHLLFYISITVIDISMYVRVQTCSLAWDMWAYVFANAFVGKNNLFHVTSQTNVTKSKLWPYDKERGKNCMLTRTHSQSQLARTRHLIKCV